MSIHQIDQSDSTNISSESQLLSELRGQAFYEHWLAMQCAAIPGTFFGILVTRKNDTETFHPVSTWPGKNADMDAVSELIERVIEEKCGLITALEKKSSSENTRSDNAYALAYPVIVSDNIFSVISIAIKVDDKKSLRHAMQQLQWGCGWIELIHWRESATITDQSLLRLSTSVDLFAKVMAEKTFDAGAVRLVTELAMMFKCDRVCVGFVKNKSVKIKHLSHSTQFGKRMNLISCIEVAMDEAVDQKHSIVVPVPDKDDSIIIMAHNTLIQQQSDISVMTVPLYIDYKIIGAITLERNYGLPFSNDDAEYCDSVTSLAVSALQEKRLNDRHLVIKTFDSFKEQLAHLLGSGHLLYKTIVIVVTATVLFFTFAESTYRLSADASLENVIQRSIVAPYDGYVNVAPVRAGDVVKKNDLIVGLDMKDLHLEKLKWLSQKEKLNRNHQEAIADHDRAKLNVINAQLDQAQAQLKLIEMQLQRAEIRAPFDGQVVIGDLSHRLGGAVKQGELLFEVAPLKSYRIKLHVKESRIADVRVGQPGALHLSALPGNVYDFTITKLTPVTVSEEGQTYFTVEAELEAQHDQLQLGMEGIGKIEIDQRKLMVILTRNLMEWLRLQWWSLWG